MQSHISRISRKLRRISVSVEFLTQQKRGAGTRFREIRQTGGRKLATILEVAEYDPPRMVRLVSEAGGAFWDTVFTVRPANNGTVLAMEMVATPKNLLARIMLPVMRKPLTKAIEKDLNAVKQWCEAELGRDNAPAR
jgi:hypothetical protein